MPKQTVYGFLDQLPDRTNKEQNQSGNNGKKDQRSDDSIEFKND